jgi:protein AroM
MISAPLPIKLTARFGAPGRRIGANLACIRIQAAIPFAETYMRRALRVLVTGQSPRPDIVKDLSHVTCRAKIQVEGAFDGMGPHEIAAEASPLFDADALGTTLSSGQPVTVSYRLVTGWMRDRLSTPGPTLLWSTLAFPELPRRDDLVLPSDLITAMLDVLLPSGTLGLVVPGRTRREMRIRERSRPGLRLVPVMLAAGSNSAAVEAAAFQLAAKRPDLVLMDCMSYTRRELSRISAITSCLVLLPSVAAIRAVATLLGTGETTLPYLGHGM